ncbi:MAG: class I SAM-dependent RNA methyltransferase [Ruminococcaceae bacterium]|nr:class I SAM-dependent RNA methyltransferase [Oscillospiraceae bacterium]
MNIKMVAPCIFGLEGLVGDELREMGAQDVTAENGRVFFCGDANMLARANICSRFSERIYIVVGSFEAHSFEELFQGVKSLDWENWLTEYDEFPVKGYSVNSDLFSVSDCQSIIKKAVVERLKSVYHIDWFEETGAKHQIEFSIIKNQVYMLIDTTGQGLHKRGYRPEANAAPLKETLAAAMAKLSRLRPYHTLYDPMCGSGTILIEGAMLVHNIAPGLHRSFSAERFEQINSAVFDEERDRAKSLETRQSDFAAYGSDIDSASLEIARHNAERAEVSDYIRLGKADVRSFKPVTDRGTVICNPPYGERMMDEKEVSALIKELGRVFPQKHGFSYSIISPSEDFEELFGRRADKRRKLYNGMIKCQLYMYYK